MTAPSRIKLIECPRDAMQGLPYSVPTVNKIRYLNLLLRAGFDTLDFGSFVSHKAVPQMADTTKVLGGLELDSSSTKLLAIIANSKGIDEAIQYDSISYLGYPFSISEVFQKRNTNSDIKTSLSLVEELINKCSKNNKAAVIYLSMAFGNPYGEAWSEELACKWVNELVKRGVSIIALSDTIGAASPESISSLFKLVASIFNKTEFGVHLHSTPENRKEKIEAAYLAGCRRFDSAVGGYGGCPMAQDHLTGNIATEELISFLEEKNEAVGLKMENFMHALEYSPTIFRRA